MPLVPFGKMVFAKFKWAAITSVFALIASAGGFPIAKHLVTSVVPPL